MSRMIALAEHAQHGADVLADWWAVARHLARPQLLLEIVHAHVLGATLADGACPLCRRPG